MEAGKRRLIDAAILFAAAVPAEVAEQYAAAICGGLAVGAAVSARDAAQVIGNPRHRTAASEFAEAWDAATPATAPNEAATAILAAAGAEKAGRERQRIELVWTGPATPAIPARQTGEFLAELIDEATSTLTLSSFGVYSVSRIADALRRAAARGVQVRVILGDRPEEAEWLDWRNQQAFGRALPDNFILYEWPVENRLRGANGEVGVLHAKCAVADRANLFLTSANLSGNALNLNMELGLCIHGGRLPEQVERHFDALIARGELHRRK